MHQSRRRVAFALASLAWISACSSWHRRDISAGVAPVISSDRPVRVTLVGGSVIVLLNPRVAGDSLIGEVGNQPQRMALALRDVSRIEDRRTSVARTGALTAGVTAGVTVVLVALATVVFLGYVLSQWSGQ